MKTRFFFFFLILFAGTGVFPLECPRGLLPGINRCFDSYRAVRESIESGKSLSAMTGDDYALLWSNCFNYRDTKGAQDIATAIKHDSLFWSMLFERLGGKTVDSATILNALRAEDVPKNHCELILPMLFTPRELRRTQNVILKQIADATERELTGMNLPCHLENVGEKLSKVPCHSRRGFGEKDYEALHPFRKAILSGGLETGCIQAFTLAAFLSCHSSDAMIGYNRIRALVLLVPHTERGAQSLGFDFAYYAYLAGKPVHAGSKKGWVVADGVQLPTFSSGIKPPTRDAYETEIVMLLTMSKERKELGLN